MTFLLVSLPASVRVSGAVYVKTCDVHSLYKNMYMMQINLMAVTLALIAFQQWRPAARPENQEALSQRATVHFKHGYNN